MSDTAKAPSAQPSSNNAVIARIPNGRRGEEIRVAFSRFKGKIFVGIRVWYADHNNEMKPSNKGINLRIELLPQIAAALAKAETQAREEKLIESQI